MAASELLVSNSGKHLPNFLHMHVVMFPLPGLSHIIPACYLAKKLAAAHGFFITFLCPDNVIDPGRAQLLAQDPNINLVAFPEKKFVLEGWSRSESVFDVLIEFAQASLKLREPFETFMQELMLTAASPVCIISDNFLSWTQDIADKYKISRYILDTSPAELVALIFFVKTLKSQGRLPLPSSSSSSINIPGLAPFPSRDCFSCLLDSNPKYLQDFFIDQFSRVHEAAGTVINTFYELEATTIEALATSALNPNKIGVWPVGPLMPSQVHQRTLVSSTKLSQEVEASIDKTCMQWLDTQSVSSVLYVSFGSIFKASIVQIQEIKLGLEASEQPFLWVLHSPPASQSSEPTNVSGLPGGGQFRVSGRGLILCCWAPQQMILSHPSTGGCITHCGWNSTLESISMGVPTIAVPQFGDQRTNCRLMVEHLKMGVEAIRRSDGILDRKEVERVVRYVMASKEGIAMRKRAKELGDSAKKAVASDGSSEANLKAFIQHLQLRAVGTDRRLPTEV